MDVLPQPPTRAADGRCGRRGRARRRVRTQTRSGVQCGAGRASTCMFFFFFVVGGAGRLLSVRSVRRMTVRAHDDS